MMKFRIKYIGCNHRCPWVLQKKNGWFWGWNNLIYFSSYSDARWELRIQEAAHAA